MRFSPAFLLACLVALLIGPPAGARAERITVFAAASLKTALEDVAHTFETETGHRVTLSFAGSSVLARQIQAGAPADIFVSANPDWMDALEAAGHLAPGTRADLLRNRLVLVAFGDAAPIPPGPDMDLAARLGQGRLAMALVNAVPAGMYGKSALEYFGQWATVAPMVAQADNVRAALALVATGAAPLGIVYATDAVAEPRVTVVTEFPETSHPPIIYPVAALTGRDGAVTAAFLSFLRTPAAQELFAAQGFAMVGR